MSPAVAIALILGWLPAQAATAQAQAPGLVQHVDLNASLENDPGKAAFSGKLFNDPPPAEGGWKGLAKLLEALTPGVDTEIPLTASQITSRISQMLDEGKNEEALQVIQKRAAQLEQQGGIGTDVQLMFLHGRALAALNRHDEAISLYQKMTTLYPELPEPWNNLAAEYVKQGKLDMARDALTMSLAANPNYGTAKANLGEVQLMLAQESFRNAAQLGVGSARSKAAQTAEILKE
ncbi:MAG: tetratricopeptide repeat protein [Burkholderiaceae bacterium]